MDVRRWKFDIVTFWQIWCEIIDLAEIYDLAWFVLHWGVTSNIWYLGLVMADHIWNQHTVRHSYSVRLENDQLMFEAWNIREHTEIYFWIVSSKYERSQNSPSDTSVKSFSPALVNSLTLLVQPRHVPNMSCSWIVWAPSSLTTMTDSPYYYSAILQAWNSTIKIMTFRLEQ